MFSVKQKIKNSLIKLQEYLHVDTLYLARGGFWLTAAFFLSSILGLVQVIVFANFLPKEKYGTYKYILSLAGAFSFLTLTGMNDAVAQATAKSGSSSILSYAVKIQLKWNFIFSAVLTGLSVYYFLNSNNLLAKCLFVLGITFPLATTFNTYGAFLTGKKDFKRGSIYGTISSSIQIISLITVALLTNDIFTLVITYALSILGPTLFFYFRTLKLHKSEIILEEKQKTELLTYTGHLSFMHVLSGIAQYVDKLVIFHYLGAIELAVYGLALAIPERIRGYVKNLGVMIMPKLAEKTFEDIHKSFYKRVFQGMLIGTLMSATYILLSPIFYKIFLPKYLDAITFSQVFSLTLIFALPANYISGIFSAHKMVRPLYYSSLGASIIKITLYIVLGRLYGIWGVIASILIVYIVNIIHNFYLLETEIRKHRT